MPLGQPPPDDPRRPPLESVSKTSQDHGRRPPTLDNLQGYSVVELTKTGDTTPVVTPPGPPAPKPPVAVTPKVPKVSLRRTGATPDANCPASSAPA